MRKKAIKSKDTALRASPAIHSVGEIRGQGLAEIQDFSEKDSGSQGTSGRNLLKMREEAETDSSQRSPEKRHSIKDDQAQ
ncbi:uncharacterized [Tachysurus ichikawai]